MIRQVVDESKLAILLMKIFGPMRFPLLPSGRIIIIQMASAYVNKLARDNLNQLILLLAAVSLGFKMHFIHSDGRM